MKTALGHLKVLDLTRILAGSWVPQNLADMGPEVITMERPGAVDDSHTWHVPLHRDAEGRQTRDSSCFLSAMGQAIGNRRSGQPDAALMKSGIAISDLLAGIYATTAILAAIEPRHVSRKVQYIDMSLLDGIVTINSCQAINYFLSAKIPQLNRDREALILLSAEAMLAKKIEVWVTLLAGRSVPCEPSHNIKQVLEDPQVMDREIQLAQLHSVWLNALGSRTRSGWPKLNSLRTCCASAGQTQPKNPQRERRAAYDTHR